MSRSYAMNLLSIFSVFAGSCWQLLLAGESGPRRRDRLLLLAWGALHIGVAVGMLGIALRDMGRHDYSAPWYVLLLRFCLAGLFLLPWNREALRG